MFVFLPVVLAGYYCFFHSQKARNSFLLLASLLFYAWGEPVYVLLMMGCIAINYGFGLAMDTSVGRVKKRFLVLAVMLDLGILFVFKYLDFTLETVGFVLHRSLPKSNLLLPIGISFFTFQAMSYVIDVYRGTTPPQKSLLDLGLYISFFPQLIAGPIVRYNTIAEQIRSRETTPVQFEYGVRRFIFGFSKKILLANTLAASAEKAFSLAQSGDLSCAMAWIGALAYTFQIYFDFSGYSDMAIGLGALFGFRFEENFRYPYLSHSVSEFWNRWHISLGKWFRDYVYFPMGGSRVGRRKLLRNLFAVWLLTGIWHGAAWQYIVWGLGYGTIISFEKLSGIPKKLKDPVLIRAYALCTFLVVMGGWVIFGAADLSAGLAQLKAMLGIGTVSFVDGTARFYIRENAFFFAAAALFSTPFPAKAARKLGFIEDADRVRSALRALWAMLLFLVSVSYLAMGAHNPFIYFTF